MKHFRSICSLLLFAVILMASSSSFAANLPKMKDKYVTDAAGILSRSELNQLRTDVKAMCDYYSTRILVGIVPTFDGYDIEEYAGMLGEHWNLDDENTMFILVKPKSDDERGEAMLVTSSDLKDVFSSEVCDKIIQNEMIPHFKNNDYFGGIEAVLEYMNNMSDDDNNTGYAATQSNENDSYDQGESSSDQKESSKGGGKGLLIALGVILAVGAAIAAFVVMSKKKNNTPHSTPNNSQNRASNESYEDPALKAQIEEKKRQLEAKKRQERELERLNREMEQRSNYEDDYSDSYQENESLNLGNAIGMANSMGGILGAGAAGGGLLNSIGSAVGGGGLLNTIASAKNPLAGKGELVKKAAIGAAVVGGTVLVLKNKDKIAGSVKSMFGGAKAALSNSSSNSSSKPRLGGSSNSSKPSLGGGNKPSVGGGGNKPSLGGGGNKPKLGGSGKPKLGGGSSSGGW